MDLPPEKFRELVFLLLYGLSFGSCAPQEELVSCVAHECKVEKKYVREALRRAEEIDRVKKTCDDYIQKTCLGYSLERIQTAERTVLRLAIFELIIEKVIPSAIVFSEAKRLAKKFSDKEASTFVQGVLSVIVEKAKESQENT